MANRQPGKALPYALRLRRSNVFDLIRENNLFPDVQDQALLLVEFDQELMQKRKDAGDDVTGRSPAISLLVDHTYSIPVSRGETVHFTGFLMLSAGCPRGPATSSATLLFIPLPRRAVLQGPTLGIGLRGCASQPVRRVCPTKAH